MGGDPLGHVANIRPSNPPNHCNNKRKRAPHRTSTISTKRNKTTTTVAQYTSFRTPQREEFTSLIIHEVQEVAAVASTIGSGSDTTSLEQDNHNHAPPLQLVVSTSSSTAHSKKRKYSTQQVSKSTQVEKVQSEDDEEDVTPLRHRSKKSKSKSNKN